MEVKERVGIRFRVSHGSYASKIEMIRNIFTWVLVSQKEGYDRFDGSFLINDMENLNIEQKENLIKKFIEHRYPKREMEDIGQMHFLRDSDDRTLRKFFEFIEFEGEDEALEDPNSFELMVWLARDKDGEIWLYFREPERNRNGYWFSEKDGGEIRLPRDKFPGITWEKGVIKVPIKITLS